MIVCADDLQGVRKGDGSSSGDVQVPEAAPEAMQDDDAPRGAFFFVRRAAPCGGGRRVSDGGNRRRSWRVFFSFSLSLPLVLSLLRSTCTFQSCRL